MVQSGVYEIKSRITLVVSTCAVEFNRIELALNRIELESSAVELKFKRGREFLDVLKNIAIYIKLR